MMDEEDKQSYLFTPEGADLSGLAPIYARLASALVPDLMRRKGLSIEDAETFALQMILDQARDTIIGIREMEDDWKARGIGRWRRNKLR